MAIGVRRSYGISASAIGAASCALLEAPLSSEAELWLARPSDEAILLGAFQRATETPSVSLVRRGSGGPRVRIGPGSLWVGLLLSRVDALVSCDEARIVNRYVRPLLRALTRCGAQAHFFGRDWISVKHRPAAWVGFAHDRASGRTALEAIVARGTPFEVDPRESYLGKEPGTIASIVGEAPSEERLADALVESFSATYGHAATDLGALPTFPVGEPIPIDPPWAATFEDAIGPLAAGLDAIGRFRFGGDLLASRDAVAALEAALPSVSDNGVTAAVDAALGAPGTALDGVRSLSNVRDVILEARRVSPQNLA